MNSRDDDRQLWAVLRKHFKMSPKHEEYPMNPLCRSSLSKIVLTVVCAGLIAWAGVPALAQAEGSLSGRVFDGDGQPLTSGAEVQLIDPAGRFAVFETRTQADGTYEFTAVFPATYVVKAFPLGDTPWIPEFYPDVKCPVFPFDCEIYGGAEITVGEGQTVTGIDFFLDRGAAIEGRIATVETGFPVEGVEVVAYVSTGLFDGPYVAGRAVTGSDGSYRIQGMQSSSGLGYFVWTQVPPGSPFSNTIYPGRPCQGLFCDASEGTSLDVRLGETTQGVDLSLWPLGSCGDGTSLCLGPGGRFQLSTTWQSNDESGVAMPRAFTQDSGYFWFFDAVNVELVIKMVDGCGFNGHFWVYISGLTDLAVDLEILDTQTQRTWTRTTGFGEPFPTVGDIQAFPCS